MDSIKDKEITTQNSNTPIYYLCERFFIPENKNYRALNKLQVDEIVSVDVGLFPESERTILDKDSAYNHTLQTNEQILCVLLIDDSKEFDADEISGFEFCGFDLAEFSTSAITNCGNYFEDTINYKDLNRVGLISDRSSARRIQSNILANHPSEAHADCELYVIWRRVCE